MFIMFFATLPFWKFKFNYYYLLVEKLLVSVVSREQFLII